MTSQRAVPLGTAKEQARYWLVRQHSGEWSTEEQGAFEIWLAEREANRRAYEQIAGLWSHLDRFKGRSFPAREAARSYRPARRATLWPLATGAVLGLTFVLLVALGWEAWFAPPVEYYRTAKGERRAITLADGSHIETNTDTALQVRLAKTERRVELEQGEALFSVAHDQARPFEVVAGGGHIRDLGTRFNVYAEPAQVSVSVLEGRVSVATGRAGSRVRLDAGERISYSAAGQLSPIEQVDRRAVTAWREGQLIFRRTPLGEALAELARYHAVEFAYDDPALPELQLSGTFRTDPLPLFLSTLEATLPIKLKVIGGRLIRVGRARR